MNNMDVINLHNCLVKDEHGNVLAKLVEEGDFVRVVRSSRCSIGTYFYILWYLSELGWDVR